MGEFVLVFPIMLTMIFGMWDIGNGLWASQKVIKSSHVIVDLLTRETNITTDQFNQAVAAGQLALDPFDDASLTVEIIHASHEDDGTAVLEWCHFHNATVQQDLLTSMDGLGNEGDRTMAVRVTYIFNPDFTRMFAGPVTMQEIAYARGRKSTQISLGLDSDCTVAEPEPDEE